jgi:MoaA/NifB/PqqE/SkfB family radical SAM enzyme
MNYDVEADWQLLNTCNYRCAYCFFPADVLGEKLKAAATSEEWGAAFDQTGLKWLLHITGGEPSIYPNFAELCERITKRHLISLNSNMTHRAWEEFSERVNPRRVSFINAGLHAREREQRQGNPAYLRNVDILRKKGFPVFASLVATPDVLARYSEMIELLAPIGMFPVPKALRGPSEGKIYPRAYTSTEREIFKQFNDQARKFYADRLPTGPNRPTIDVFSDDAILRGEPYFRGLSCEAGHLFFKVETSGEIVRCSPSRSYGNILNGTFVRGEGPTPCDTNYCFYFCQKYSAKPSLRHTIYSSARTVAKDVRDVLRASLKS